MSNRASRWGWLAVFAAINLIFWIAAAAIVGFVASDRIDLGVESFIREKQATVVALSDETPSRLPTQISAPTSVPTNLAPSTEPVSPQVEPTLQPPPATVELPVTPFPDQRMTPHPTTSAPPPTVPPAPAAPSPLPTIAISEPPPASSDKAMAAPANGAMLLADPSTQELFEMDAEIRSSAAGRPVQIRYGEDALNREIAALLATAPEVPYRNVWADLQSNRVVLTGDVTVGGFDLPTQVEGRVAVAGCQPVIELESVSIGGLLTPSFVKKEVATLVQDSLNWYPADYPLCLEQIVMEEGRATLYGSVR